jgi:hypothetical protein
MSSRRSAFFLLLLWTAAAGVRPATGSTPAAEGGAGPTPPPPRPEALYSIRTRRRAQALLRLHLLEMREAGLERVRAVIERRLPVDSLFDPVPGPSPGSQAH